MERLGPEIRDELRHLIDERRRERTTTREGEPGRDARHFPGNYADLLLCPDCLVRVEQARIEAKRRSWRESKRRRRAAA